MRVCFIVWRYPSFSPSDHAGGAEKQLQKLVSELNDRGHSSTIISGRKGRNPFTDKLHDKVIVHRIPTSSIPGLSMIIFMILLPIFLVGLHYRKRFDIIHLILPDLFIIPIYILTRLVKIPIVSRIAADELEQSNNRGIWQIIRSIIRSFILKTDSIQTLNPKTYDDALRLGKAEDDVYLIPNGVVVPDVQRDYSVIHKKIIYIGAMRHYPNKLKLEQKNLVYLIDAFEKISDILPNLILLMIGDGNYREFLEVYSKLKGLESKIIFTGYQSDVLPYLAEADILLNPSHFEGMPNTVIEAMVMGVYVICSNIPEHQYLIENNKYGQLVNKSDHTSLIKEILRFYEDPKSCALKAIEGRRKIETQLSLSKITMQILGMYSDLINPQKEVR